MQRELSDLKEVASGMRAKWEKEKDIHKVRDLREHLERLRELEAEGNYDLNKAAELRHGKIPAIEKVKKRKKWARIINKKIVYYVRK